MYIPSAFIETDITRLHAVMQAAGLAQLVSATATGPYVTPLPLLLDASEGAFGTLYGHIAKANPHWQQERLGGSLAIFMGPDAYVTPSWYATKRETGKVVPTWNYVTVHAHGTLEIFHDAERLLEVVSRLTTRHEAGRPHPWAVSDAPEPYIAAQLRGIVGVRLPILRLEGKVKMSQNRSDEDRAGVVAGLNATAYIGDRQSAQLVGAGLKDKAR